jgi:ribose/xylose/arabinose/galactoside ABC-type transport system permease subunit
MTTSLGQKVGPNPVIQIIKRFPMELILAALIVILIFTAPGFPSLRNLLNVLRTVSMLGIIAFAMTAVIIAGEIDLSVGAGAPWRIRWGLRRARCWALRWR